MNAIIISNETSRSIEVYRFIALNADLSIKIGINFGVKEIFYMSFSRGKVKKKLTNLLSQYYFPRTELFIYMCITKMND